MGVPKLQTVFTLFRSFVFQIFGFQISMELQECFVSNHCIIEILKMWAILLPNYLFYMFDFKIIHYKYLSIITKYTLLNIFGL